MLDYKLGLTGRGVPFSENNRTEGTMVPSWADPDVFPIEAIARSAAEGALPCHQNNSSHIN